MCQYLTGGRVIDQYQVCNGVVMKLDKLLVIIYSSWVLVCKTVCVAMPKFWHYIKCRLLENSIVLSFNVYWCHCFLPPHDNRHSQFRLTRSKKNLLKVLTPGSWNQQICQLNKVRWSVKIFPKVNIALASASKYLIIMN